MASKPVSYIFDISGHVAEVRSMIRPHIGFTADIMDMSRFVEACCELVFAGTSSNHEMVPSPMLTACKVPSSVANAAVDIVTTAVRSYMTAAVPSGIPEGSWCSVFCNEYGDLHVTVRPAAQQRNKDPLELLRENVAASMENGDWYSEQFRRMVGL